MSAVADFRIYQSAAQYAQRVGVPQREAVHAVAVAIKAGGTGQHVACQFQHAAMRTPRPDAPGAA